MVPNVGIDEFVDRCKIMTVYGLFYEPSNDSLVWR